MVKAPKKARNAETRRLMVVRLGIQEFIPRTVSRQKIGTKQLES